MLFYAGVRTCNAAYFDNRIFLFEIRFCVNVIIMCPPEYSINVIVFWLTHLNGIIHLVLLMN